MSDKEIKALKRIPKKYRVHITDLKISKSGECNERGRELMDYTVTWDNGDEHTFQSIDFMVYAIKEYSVDGYYVSP